MEEFYNEWKREKKLTMEGEREEEIEERCEGILVLNLA